MLYDMHTHTKYSYDCKSEPKDVIKTALKNDLNNVVFTDHNSIGSWKHIPELEKKYKIKLIKAQEIRVSIDEVPSKKVDFIGYYMNEFIEKFTDVFEVIDKIKEQGGISVLPHPCRPGLEFQGKLEEIAKKADAIETLNGADIIKNRELCNQDALKLSQKFSKAQICGSDAHILDEVGLVATKFENNLRNAIKNRKTETIILKKVNEIKKTKILLERGAVKLMKQHQK